MVDSNRDTLTARELVVQKAVALGLDEAAPLSEAILISDGFYVGRRFLISGLRAIWNEAKRTLSFYDAKDSPLETVSLDPQSANEHESKSDSQEVPPHRTDRMAA